MALRANARATTATLAVLALIAGGVVASHSRPAPASADAGAARPCEPLLSGYAVDGSTVTIASTAIEFEDGGGRYTEYRFANVTYDDRSGPVTIEDTPEGLNRIDADMVTYSADGSESRQGVRSHSFAVESARIAGSNRYETASEIDELIGLACGTNTLYIASGQGFPDALGAVPVAAGGHMLLTRADSIPDSTLASIQRLDPSRIVLLGGPTTISPDVEEQLEAVGHNVSRIAGENRYDTALLVAESRQPGGWSYGCSGDGDCGPAPASGAIVVTGQNFPDAVSAGSVAAALDVPVILVPGGAASLDQGMLERISELVDGPLAILGGTASVSAGIEASLASTGLPIERLAGANRYETNALAIRYGMEHGEDRSSLDFVATGRNYPDALTGGVLASYGGGSAVYLAPHDCVMPVTRDLMLERDAGARVLLGDETALSASVLQAVCS